MVDKALGLVEYGSGGGITWGTCPGAEQEWEEVLLKARAPV